MEWVIAVSAAVTALAAAVSAGATVVLVKVTYRYVDLTRELLQLNQEQARAQDRVSRGNLAALVDRLLASVTELPVDVTDRADSKARGVPLWSEEHVRDLETIGSALPGGAEPAARAARALLWLRERVLAVRAVDPRQGYDWSHFRWEEWGGNLDAATEALGELRRAADR